MANKPTQTNQDAELAAIHAVLGALAGLDGDALRRVLDYVFGRLGIPSESPNVRAPSMAITELIQNSTDSAPARRTTSTDIRSLKEQKQPQSANQMATIVALYLSEYAPDAERKDKISTDDITRYFKQAGFVLPAKPAMTLPNASSAGYFDAIGNGLYKLNPVGYNLAVHQLPRGGSTALAAPKKKAMPKKKVARAK